MCNPSIHPRPQITLDPATHLVTITGQRGGVMKADSSETGGSGGGEGGAAADTPVMQSHVSFTRSFSLPQVRTHS